MRRTSFTITDKLSITPGLRYEWIDTRSDGYYQKVLFKQDPNGLPVETTVVEIDTMQRKRPVWLAGLGVSYKPTATIELYANISENYRAINFTDLRILNPNMYVDPSLKDESGYSADLGWRGNSQWLNYDASLFFLKYNDKISSVYERTVRARRNISDAYIAGIETFAETNLMRLRKPNPAFDLMLFTNIALIEGRYYNSENTAFQNKKVELVPAINFKTGLTFRKKSFSASWQYAYVGRQFTDAENSDPLTYIPGAIIGPVPAFSVMDLSLQYSLKSFRFEGGINNLTNEIYFTRRADGYPGPGIIPSDARSFYLTVGYKFQKN